MDTKLIFDSVTHTVIATISGRVDSAKFRNFALQEIALIKEKKASKLIVDIAGLGVMNLDDQQWLQKEWNAQAIQNGLQYAAFIVPKDIFGKVAMQKVNQDQKFVKQISISYFEKVEKAQEWLTQF